MADDGVPIVGSGSPTHNLHQSRSGGAGAQAAHAAAFAARAREAVERRDRARLRRTPDDASHARRAHLAAEHAWPMRGAAGAADLAPPVQVIEGGIVHGVLSMGACACGPAATAA